MMRRLWLALVIVAAVLHMTPLTTTALVDGTVDEEQTFSNVGALMLQFLDGNPFGMPPGTTLGVCTGTLIHKRVFLSAGHCVAPGVFGLPPGVRLAITFSPDDVFDEDQWIDVNPARRPSSTVTQPSSTIPQPSRNTLAPSVDKPPFVSAQTLAWATSPRR